MLYLARCYQCGGHLQIIAKNRRNAALDALRTYLEENSQKVERALKEFWRSQEPDASSGGPLYAATGYQMLADDKLKDLWRNASRAGVAYSWTGVDAADAAWVDERAQWFARRMGDAQAQALQVVKTQAPMIYAAAELPLSPDELDAYLALSTGLTEQYAVAVIRYGAHLKRSIAKESVQKAILPAAITSYAARLRNSRAAQIAATELAAAYNAGKTAVYRVAQALGLSPKDTDERSLASLGDALETGSTRGVSGGGFTGALRYEKVWVTQPGACDYCGDLEGKTVPVDEEFDEGDPPLHANCVCTTEHQEVEQ